MSDASRICWLYKLETLNRSYASWARALELAQKANAPAPVQERSESTLAAIDAACAAIEGVTRASSCCRIR